MLLLKNANFFIIFFFSVKIRLETRFDNVLDRKETFLTIKTTFSSPKNGIFPNVLTHTFGQKIPNFSLFRFG